MPVEFVEISDDLAQAADQAEETVERQAVAEPVSESGSATASEGVVDPVVVIEARQARVIEVAEEAGLAVTRPSSRVGVGVYGGSGDNVCDAAGMVAFFDQNPDVADAWARVHRIGPGEIEDFLDGLTAGYLLDDYDVVNHRLVDTTAEPFDATMEAGTAVLVDDDGIPRVRCLCGNPLQPPSGLTAYEIVGLWSGDWGDFYMQETGGEARAAYDCCSTGGIILRRYDDGVWRGWFKDSFGTGRAEFRVEVDGSLDGRWHFGAGGGWSENWDLEPAPGGDAPQVLRTRLQDDEFYADIWQGD